MGKGCPRGAGVLQPEPGILHCEASARSQPSAKLIRRAQRQTNLFLPFQGHSAFWKVLTEDLEGPTVAQGAEAVGGGFCIM